MRRLYKGESYKCQVFCGLVIICVIVYFKYYQHHDYELYIPEELLKDERYPTLGIAGIEDFPSHGKHRIPKIIHQTWSTTHVPLEYVGWIKSWTKNHPDWDFMFWTDENARDLIAERHPSLLEMYDGYTENIRRADAMRYVILYEYGGVFADLDLESLLPLDNITRKYACVLAQEPYEHPIIDGNFEHLLINAFMACKAKHPLMKKFMDNLPLFSHMWNVLDSTGPHYITSIHRQHISQDTSNLSSDHGVYIAPAEYFIPTIDPAKFGYMKSRCLNFNRLSYAQQTACVSLKRNGLRREPYKYSFTVHHWAHTYLTPRVSLERPTDVRNVIPNVMVYGTERSLGKV